MRSTPMPKAKPEYSSGSMPHPLQHLGMDHPGAQYLYPAAVLAQTAALATAHEAIDGYLAARLNKGEIVHAEAALAVLAEQPPGKFK